jgi:hypothetical protein
MNFNDETDAILRDIGRREYTATLLLIDELERRADDATPGQRSREARVSCAELRLDAALETRQPLSVCEGHYRALLQLGVEPRHELMKSVILANLASSDRSRIVQLYVLPALARASSEALPQSLLDAANKLIHPDA